MKDVILPLLGIILPLRRFFLPLLKIILAILGIYQQIHFSVAAAIVADFLVNCSLDGFEFEMSGGIGLFFDRKLIKVFTWFVFVVYFLILTKFILFKYFGVALHDQTSFAMRLKFATNFIPFHTIGHYLFAPNINLSYRIRNLLGNVLLFVPFGFLLPIALASCRTYVKTVVIALCLSSLFECIQFITGLGSFDVDDMLLNTLGAWFGYSVFALVLFVFKPKQKRLPETETSSFQ